MSFTNITVPTTLASANYQAHFNTLTPSAFINADGTTQSNRSGGIQGGISNGMDIYFNVAFKPVATIMQKQETITKDGQKVEMQGKGRHDP